MSELALSNMNIPIGKKLSLLNGSGFSAEKSFTKEFYDFWEKYMGDFKRAHSEMFENNENKEYGFHSKYESASAKTNTVQSSDAKILGISDSATEKEIKIAFHRLAVKHHPDKNKGREEQAHKEFIKLVDAYERMLAKVRRQKYNDRSSI